MLKPSICLIAALVISQSAIAEQTIEADVVPANATASQTATSFDLSVPADYERCQQTKELSKYLSSIPKNDAKKIAELKTFLLSCRELLNERIDNTQNEISKLKQQP